MITINAGQSTSFPRIADAIEAAKAYAPMPVTIHIAPGRYHEKLTVSQPHVTLMGDDASNTILTYDDYAREIMPDGIKRGTFRTYTLFFRCARYYSLQSHCRKCCWRWKGSWSGDCSIC